MSYSAIIALNASSTRRFLIPTYGTAGEAFAAAPDDALILVASGTYPVPSALNIDRTLTVVGHEEIPSFTLLANTFNLLSGADLTLDLVRLYANTGSTPIGAIHVPDRPVKLLANRVWIDYFGGNRGGVLGATNQDAPGCLRFQQCSFTSPVFGSPTFWGTDLSNVALHRCYTPFYNVTFGSSSLFEDDKTLSPLTGYGHSYGMSIVDFEPYFADISSRVLDLRGIGSPRVVLFDWSAPTTFATPAQVDSDGHWSGAMVPHGVEFGIYYLSADNRCPPIIHGPYTAE
jgi:hypothetical protein